MKKITLKKKPIELGRFKKSFVALLSVSALVLSSTNVNAQCDPGYSSVNVRIEDAGDYVDENFVTISTQINGGGVILWAQTGTGAINTNICLLPGVYYINAYDTYGDGWNGNILHLSSYGSSYAGFPVIDPDNDYIEDWGGVLDLEGSYMFTVGAPPSCLPPTNLITSNATLSSIDVSWTGVVGQTGGYELVWGPVGFDVNTATPIALTSSTYTINTSVGNYEYAVRQYCGTTEVSNWSSKKTFRINLLGEDCSAPILVSSLPYTTTDNTGNYGDNPTIEGTPGTSCGTTNSYLSGNDVVYKYIADFTGVVRVKLSGLTDTYSGVFAYNSCADIGVSCAGGIGSSSSNDKFFDLAVTEGEDYFIVISTWASPQTVGYTLTLSQVTCPTPTNVITETPTLNSTQISWNGEAGGSYEINWGVGTFTAGEGASSQTTTGLSYTIGGLNPSTNYRYFVRRVCGANGQSDWAGPYTFATQVAPAQAPWTEGFASTTTPVGWTISSSLSIQSTNSRVPNLDGAFIAGNLYSGYPTGTITTLPITNIQSGFELSFDYLISDWSNYPVQPLANSLSIAVKISIDNGANYTTIQTLTNDGTTQGWQNFVYDMTAFVGETVKIQIVSTRSSDDFVVAFDNISILGTPCNTSAPTGAATQTLVSGQTLADLVVTGTSITWYSDAALTTAIPASTIAVNGTTYYATQTIDSCESETALAITVTVEEPCNTAAPTGAATQTLVSGQTLADLLVTGTSITWYSDAALTTAIPASTVAVNGTTYYATQTIDSCESETALAITVTVEEPCNTAAPTGAATQTLVSGQTLADLVVTGTSITWYSDAALTTAIPASTVAVNGTTYYATQTIDSCESETALAITVTVEEPCNTAAPTGEAVQNLIEGQTLADLVVTGTSITWYSDVALTTAIPASTVAVNGTTYYATQTIDSCESETALAITVSVSLSNNSLDLAILNIYPNPTKDVLHIDYKSVISNVTIFDIKGRQVGSYVLNATTNSISVDALSSGTYLLKVETEAGETSTVKFIKK